MTDDHSQHGAVHDGGGYAAMMAKASSTDERFSEEEAPSAMTKWARSTRSGKPKTVAQRPKTMAAAVFNRARVETQGMIDSADWTGCAARHLVALYDLMHAKVYEVEAVMSSSERHLAVLRMGSFVKREFSGDYEKVIDYFRWVWSREMGREKWRREEGREGQRLTVGFCISGMLLTDFRLAMTRKARR